MCRPMCKFAISKKSLNSEYWVKKFLKTFTALVFG